MVDWANINDNHFNSGMATLPASPTSGIAAWVQNNGSAMYCGGNDLLNIINLQVWGYATGVLINGGSGYNHYGPYIFNGCSFDLCYTAFSLIGTIGDVQILNSYYTGGSAAGVAGTMVTVGSGVIISGFTLSNCYGYGNINQFVWMGQGSQTVANCIITGNVVVASPSSSSAAVVYASGSYIQVLNNIFQNFSSVASLGSATNTQVAYNNGSGGSGASGITIGSSTITSGTSGRVLIDSSGVVGELAPGTSGNVITSSGGAWVSQAPSSGGLTIGSTPISGGFPGELLIIDASGSTLQMTPTFTMSGIIGSTANGGSGRWTAASVFGVSGSDWGVEATCSNSSYTGNGALIARVNNTSNSFAAFYYTTSNYGSITVSGGGTAYNTTSDYRLKENVQTAPGGLSIIQSMRPVTYTWSNHPEYGTDTGFIAHELQIVVPNAVSGTKDAVKDDGSIDPQQVNYTKLVPYLVAAIQELAAQVADLKSKLPNT
jgi:hypothetical protein